MQRHVAMEQLLTLSLHCGAFSWGTFQATDQLEQNKRNIVSQIK